MLAAAALLILAADPAAGQWPFGRRRQPPPPPPAQTAPAQAAPAPAAPAQPAAPTPEQIQAEEKARLLRDARARDFTRQVTAQNAEERLMAWGLVRAIDPADGEALRGYEQARRDLDAAKKLEEANKAREADAETQKQVRAQLREANAAFDAGELDRADRAVEDVLATSPDDPQALSLRAAVAEKRRSREFRRLLLSVGGFFGLSAAVIFWMAWRGIKERRSRKKEEAASTPAAPRALLKVVDGISRGRLVPLQADVFRIGAAQGEGAGEQNDLVISDSGAVVSRYHCSIIRKGKDYLLIDSSLNGTELNGTPLQRGEHHVLADGDEFILARAARVKFLVT
nr:FHA domain-containing protein [Longimicrobium terrae]